MTNENIEKWIHSIRLIDSSIRNLIRSSSEKIFYVIDPADWSIWWDGYNLKRYIKNLNITRSSWGLRNKIVHFGYGQLFNEKVAKKNKCILTYFHISPSDKQIINIGEISNSLQFIHTSCNLTKEELIKLGAPKKKIRVIPLPVDLIIFRPLPSIERNKLKKYLNLPINKIIIGSFQKDGVGWGEGLEPKLIKGPDIFCDVVEELARKYPIHVLLTGPARGYVKNRLKKAKISYTHVYLKNYPEIVKYYNLLDLYLVTSRVEGGPKSILESMACGIPIISTKVGMAPDVIKNGNNGFIADVEDKKNLVMYAKKVLNNKKLKIRLIKNALETVKKYELKKIANEYYKELYLPLLKNENSHFI